MTATSNTPQKKETTSAPRHELVANNLRKIYGMREVVRNVSIKVHSGQVVGLLGPNGAGKTTTFYMVVGLISPNDGEILLDGSSITHYPIYKRARLGISYLPQEASIFKNLTVEENIRAILELQVDSDGKALRSPKIEERLEQLINELEIGAIRQSAGRALSGGERRRTEIARALAADPDFILLDEPFAGVDPITVTEIQGIIRYLKKRGIGVLITDHNVRETLNICDYAYIINKGSVLAHGDPQEVSSDANVRRLYLGENFQF